VQALMSSFEGMGKLLCLQFQELQPELTDEQAWDLFDQAEREYGTEGLQALLGESQGTVPKTAAEAEDEVYKEKGLVKEPQKKSTSPPIG
jgi:hypothetical protein